MMRPVAASAVCLALLCACESDPASRPPPVGVSVQPVEAGRFRVTYRGSSRMSPPEVQDRALLQAAQLSLSQGFDWFQVATRSQGPAPPTTPQFSIGLGGGSFGRGGGVGVGGAETFGGQASYVVTLEIVGGHGPRPSTPDAYDARDVANTLGPRLTH